MTKALVSIFHWVCGYLVFIIGGTILLLASCLPFERLRYRAATYLCRTLVWASGIRLRIEGNYPTDQSCIYMANHASFMDMFILGAIMKGKFTGVVAAAWPWAIPISFVIMSISLWWSLKQAATYMQ